MISPISFSSTANIAPVPKPPTAKAVNFTGIENVISKAKGAKNAAKGFVTEKAVPFAKSTFEKAKGLLPKVKEYGQKAIQWVKNLNILEKAKGLFETIKNSGIVKKVTEFATKIFKKAA